MENEKKPKKRSLRLLSVFTVVLLLAFMVVPAFAVEGDLVIDAGTYRFNDTLSFPNWLPNAQDHYNGEFAFVCNGNQYLLFNIAVAAPATSFGVSYFVDADGEGEPTFAYMYGLSGYGFADGWQSTDYQTITILNDTEVTPEFYEWFIANAVPGNSFRDSVTSGLTVVIEWVGAVVSSLFSGELSGLLPIVAIPVAVTLLVLAIYFIRRSIWGA